MLKKYELEINYGIKKGVKCSYMVFFFVFFVFFSRHTNKMGLISLISLFFFCQILIEIVIEGVE